MKGHNKLTRREMLKLSGGLAAGSVLAASVPSAMEQTPVAQAQSALTLEVFDPSGAYEVSKLHAPRLTRLEGKTICELGNESWQAQRTFPYLRDLIKNQYPTAKIIPYTEFPLGTDAIQTQAAADAVKKAGCDAVIIGNGG